MTEYPYGVPYHKIDGPFKRDPVTMKLTSIWRSETVCALRDLTWVFTEKIDGTNVRIHWDGYKISFNGRKDTSQMPKRLSEVLQGYADDNEVFFEQVFGVRPATVYGEGFGAGIQKGGGNYSDAQQFAAFDVHTGGRWLSRHEVENVVPELGLPLVPAIDLGPLSRGIELVSQALLSQYSPDDEGFESEGLVAVPEIGGYDMYGNRIIVKIKAEDFR
jgi:hypothetical protein